MTIECGRATEAVLSIVLIVALAITLVPTPVAGTTGTLTITADTTLTEDHNGNIVIAVPNITLDCAGYNVTGSGSGDGILLRGRFGVTVKNCEVTNFQTGFDLYLSSGNELTNNTASDNGLGFSLVSSSRNTFTKNTVIGNAGFSVQVSSNDNIFEENTANGNGGSNGFFLFTSSGNTFTNNTASGHSRGFNIGSSPGNTFRKNTASSNADRGFNLYSFGGVPSDDNILEENTANGNGIGLRISQSSGNTIFHNNIIDNTVQAGDDNPAANDWHHPVLEEGNFWSDYTGVDDGSGTGKHAIAGDGVGDTDIPWPGPGYDNYPLIDLIDRTPPATTASQSGTSGQAGWFRSAVGVALSAADDLSGVTSTFYRIDGGAWLEYVGPFTVDGDGIHTVEYHSTDVAGNAEDVKSVDIRIDTMAPKTSFSLDGTLGENGWYTSTVAVTLTASDATSGVTSVAYRIGGGAQQEYTNPFIVDGDGTHTVEYFSTDIAGNTEAVRSLDVKIDTTPPTLFISFPAAEAFLVESDVEVTWATADTSSGIDHFEVVLDGGTPVVLPATATSHTLTDVADGAHTIAVKAFDVAGNLRPESVRVTVDTTLPTLSITSPVSGSIRTSSSVEVTWAAADATSGIDHFEVVLDGGTPVVLPATATSHTFTGVADGAHTVAVTAFDVAGNSVVLSVDLTVDTNILSLSGPYGSGPLIGTSVGIIAAAAAGVALLLWRRRAGGKEKA